jgi:uncharacterized protein
MTEDRRMTMAEIQIELPIDQIADFCKRWKITGFALFGSVLRDDFRPDSDIDVLVTFAPDADWSLFHKVDMLDELKAIFRRDVDLVERPAIERSSNYIRRKAILGYAKSIYGT